MGRWTRTTTPSLPGIPWSVRSTLGLSSATFILAIAVRAVEIESSLSPLNRAPTSSGSPSIASAISRSSGAQVVASVMGRILAVFEVDGRRKERFMHESIGFDDDGESPMHGRLDISNTKCHDLAIKRLVDPLASREVSNRRGVHEMPENCCRAVVRGLLRARIQPFA